MLRMKKPQTQNQESKTNSDQVQPTERQDKDSTVSEPKIKNDQQDVEEEAATKQHEIQQLAQKLSAEEALRNKAQRTAMELEAELQQKTVAVEEALLKVGQLEQDLLKTKVDAEEELKRTQTSYMTELEHLKKVNIQATAAQMTAEEQLQNHLRLRQEEEASNRRGQDNQHEIQQLTQKLSAEEALRNKAQTTAMELEAELQQKAVAVEEALLKVGQLEQDLLKTKVAAQEELRRTQTSYMIELEHLKKVNIQVAAAQMTAEEQLNHLRPWQEEEAEQQKCSEKDNEVSSRINDLDSGMKDMSHQKPTKTKKKGWLRKLFSRSGSK